MVWRKLWNRNTSPAAPPAPRVQTIKPLARVAPPSLANDPDVSDVWRTWQDRKKDDPSFSMRQWIDTWTRIVAGNDRKLKKLQQELTNLNRRMDGSP